MSVIRNSQITIRRSEFIIWPVLAFAVGGFYLLMAWFAGYAGFPLDDAWIHQTYARNLAESGQLAFTPGIPSAGSTAPLWSLLLSVGYLLGVPFRVWTYGFGLLFLGLTGWSASRLAERLFPRQRGIGLWVGLFCVLEWHLVWAAVSGMETMLFVWLSVLLVEQYAAGWPLVSGRRAFGLGLLGGLLVLTRPEGIGLVGLVGLDLARRWWQQPHRSGAGWLAARWGAVVAGVALPVLPYMLFHLSLTGLPFPNTLYAKQAEYGVVLSSYPLWWRLFGNLGPTVETVQGVFRVIFIGPQILLLPGLVWAAWLTVKERRVELWFIWVWWISFLLLYGLRLPVTYQHGRYQIPAIVWVLLLGVWGTARLMATMQRRRAWRVISRAWLVSLGLLLLAFTLIGARSYARDVRFIEQEMVATAHWLAVNTPPDALLAAHDIGAIGYFTRRPLIDLAGLVTPQVIPFIRDEIALFDFVRAQQADYLVTFPDWYPAMVSQPGLTVVFAAGGPDSGNPMTVYRVTIKP